MSVVAATMSKASAMPRNSRRSASNRNVDRLRYPVHCSGTPTKRKIYGAFAPVTHDSRWRPRLCALTTRAAAISCLPATEQYACVPRPVGGDCHGECRTRAETAVAVPAAFLQFRRSVDLAVGSADLRVSSRHPWLGQGDPRRTHVKLDASVRALSHLH